MSMRLKGMLKNHLHAQLEQHMFDDATVLENVPCEMTFECKQGFMEFETEAHSYLPLMHLIGSVTEVRGDFPFHISSLYFDNADVPYLTKDILYYPNPEEIAHTIMITAAIPFSVIMIPLFIIVRSMGIANSLLALILPMIPHAYGIFLYRQFFAGIPHELYEAAMIDGASYSRTLFQVFFPMAIPVTISMAVAFFLTNWNNYLWPLVVIHDRNLWVVQLAITSFKESYSSAWNLIFAASLMASIPIILLFVFLQRYFTSSVKLAGIKG